MNTLAIYPPAGLVPQPVRVALVTLASLVTGFALWIFYALAAQPLFETCQGGSAGSVGAAAVAGLLLAGSGLVLAVRTKRGLLCYSAFTNAYVVFLLALHAVSPLLWGHMTCSGGFD